jgi:1-phosphofructokinase
VSSDGPDQGVVAVFGPAPFVSITVEQLTSGAQGDEIHLHAAGQGVWVARAAARLGARVTLVTVAGGEHGTVLRALLDEEAFRTELVDVAGEGSAYVDDRRHGDRARLAEQLAPPLGRHEIDDLYGTALTTGLAAGAMVLCGTGDAALLPPDLYRRLASDLHHHGVRVVADLSGDLALAAARGGVDVLKVSVTEAAALGLGGIDTTGELVELAQRVRSLGAGRVVISRGGAPALAVDDRDVLEMVAPELEEADHRGAGDSMTAALAVGLARKEPWSSALARAAAAGAANVTRHGLGTSSAAEVAVLQRRVRVSTLRV